MLIEATEYYEWQEGFISANIQRSMDGTAVEIMHSGKVRMHLKNAQ
jgi:hypothetical protein